MPVCITGMHRSGTSLVANLLRLCGLYLGEQHDLIAATIDNESGYWENRRFSNLNDEILRTLGGTWYLPPELPDGWAEAEGLNAVREKVEILLLEFLDHEPWGWKDPRNSLTLPFWTSLNSIRLPFWLGQAPKLKTVVCLRNPFDVFCSLRDREHEPNSAGANLWLIYYRSVLDSTLPEDRIITHYDAYFQDARAELRRVLSFLNMPASENLIEQSTSAVLNSLRHYQFGAVNPLVENVDQDIFDLYRDMCAEANHIQPLFVPGGST